MDKLFPFLFFALLILIDNTQSLTPLQQTSIDELVQGAMDYNKIPGLGLTIVENNKNSSYVKGYGFEDVENDVVASESTRFCIASISKTFAATIVMKVLSEKFPQYGSMVLDIPLKELNPNGNFTFSDRYRSEMMTFRDLLSHRHGIETESFGSSAGVYADQEEYIYRSRYAKEQGPFRVQPMYSNTFYVLIGKLISDIADIPYEILLQSLFVDLGMTDSLYVVKNGDYENLQNMSKGYYLKDGSVEKLNMSLINRIFIAPSAGGILTTPRDMEKYMKFHLNYGKVGDRQIIPEDAMKWMRQSGFALDWMQFKSEGSDIVQGTYALGTGFQLGVLDGWAYMTHSGQLTPFMSEMRIYPELQLATFTINNGPVNLYDSPYGHPYLHEEIFKIMIGTPSKQKTPTGSFVPKQRPKSVFKPNGVLPIDQADIPGIYGHPVEGELEIIATPENPGSPFYFRYGEWATGNLTIYPDVPNTFIINWDTDLVQEIYFSGEFVEFYAQFFDENTLYLHISGGIWEYKRGVSLDNLPEIPWEEDSCGPETRERKVEL